MRNVLIALLLVIVLALAVSNARADEPGDAILGAWHTTENKSLVNIFKQDGRYCGQVLSLTRPNWPANDKLGMGGKPRTDRMNPNPQLRDRPIAGIQFMSNFSYAGGNLWQNGRIYDPEVGKTYKCKMTLIATNRLEVRGFIGLPLFGRTVTWTR